jgi:hypothetical protein
MANAKLNQIVAVEKGVKTTAHQKLTELHQNLQKASLLAGISRTYQPRVEDGDQLPPESTKVQFRATAALRQCSDILGRLFDVTATKDWGNTDARADVVVDDKVVVAQVPVTYLLFLEKQLVDLRTFVRKLPVLDTGENWTYDPNSDCYASDRVETARTKKVPRTLVKYEATTEHPAQTEVWHEDVIVGTWSTVKFSGALPQQRINTLLGRVEALQQAVKFAREEANGREIEDQKVADSVFKFLFAD